MTTAAIYARVSTSDQDCTRQLSELREYAARRGWTVAGEYVDTGVSGTRANRPQLDRLMADARARKFDCVLVLALDRWARSVANCIASLEELGRYGVRWIATSQNLDTDASNPMARFMLHIMAAVAALEREMIRERVVSGVNEARRKGKRLGRPPAVFDRARAADMRAAGISYAEIGKTLGVGRSTVHEALTD